MTPPAYLTAAVNPPPHWQGQLAAWRGEPVEANPHPEAPCTAEDYPGPHVAWRWGWTHARAVMARSKRPPA